MQMREIKIGFYVALGVFTVWLIVDGTVLYIIAALVFAGVVPFVDYTIPAQYMFLFWLFCAGLITHYFSRPRTIPYIKDAHAKHSLGLPKASFYYATAKSTPVTSKKKRVRRAGQDVL